MAIADDAFAGGTEGELTNAKYHFVVGTDTMPHISVIIPVYRSAGCINELTRRLQAALPSVSADYEIIFIEDGGGDQSWDIICTLARQDSRIRGLQFSRNFGQHFALTAGVDHSRGDWIVTMDCDLQDPPEYIKLLYDTGMKGFDVVLARRVYSENGGTQPFTSKIFYRRFDFLTDTHSDPEIGAFRIFSRRVRDAFVGMREQTRFFGGMMQWMGFPSTSIDVPRFPRFDGESSYTLHKRLALAIPAIISFSNKPLILVVNFGFLISLIGFSAGVIFAIRQIIYNIPVPGWTSVIVSLYFLTGIIMVTLGVVGVYIGKIFDQTKGRPLYIVSRTTHNE